MNTVDTGDMCHAIQHALSSRGSRQSVVRGDTGNEESQPFPWQNVDKM
jgi:hypothetical protein